MEERGLSACTAKVEEIPLERVLLKKRLVIYRREKLLSWLKLKGSNPK